MTYPVKKEPFLTGRALDARAPAPRGPLAPGGGPGSGPAGHALTCGALTSRRGCRRMPSPKLAFKERRKPAPKGQEEASETQTTRAGLVPGPRKELPRLGTKRTRSSVERWAKGIAERKPALPRRTLRKLRLWVEPVPHRWCPQTGTLSGPQRRSWGGGLEGPRPPGTRRGRSRQGKCPDGAQGQ